MPSQKHPVQIQRDEHDNDLYAKRISMVSAATIYAVTNTTISLATADIEIGAVEIKDASTDTRATVGADGLHVDLQSAATIYAVVNTASSAQASVVLDTGTKYIGLVTVANDVTVTATDLDIRNLNPAFDVVSVEQGSAWSIGSALPAGDNNIGNVDIVTMPEVNSLATVTQAQSVTIEGFEIPSYDYIALTYVAAGNGAGEIETVTYKTGGAGGSTQGTLTLGYDGNDKLSSVTKS